MFVENIENTSSAGVDGWKEAGRIKSGESQPVDLLGHAKPPVLVPEFLVKCLSYYLLFKLLPDYHRPSILYRWASEGG